MIPYFAYGSNMSYSRMKKRLEWIPIRERAILMNYTLIFNQAGFKEIHWSPANIQPLKDTLVEGIIYHVEERDLRILDGYEKYYQRKDVKVILADNGSLKAVTYLAMDSRIKKPPTREYLDFLLEGREFFTDVYFCWLQQIQTVEDEMDQAS